VTHRGPCQPPPCWDSVIRAMTTSVRQLRHSRTRETCSQQTRPMTRIAGVSDSAAPENRVAGTDSSGCPDSGGRRVSARNLPRLPRPQRSPARGGPGSRARGDRGLEQQHGSGAGARSQKNSVPGSQKLQLLERRQLLPALLQQQNAAKRTQELAWHNYL